MSFSEALLRLLAGPAELFDEMVCTAFLRLGFSPGAAILALSLTVCFLATPLRPRNLKEFREARRLILPRLLLQTACLVGSWRWIAGTQAFRDAAFGSLRDLGIPGGLALFWGGYALSALLRRMAGAGYRPMVLNARQRKTDRGNRILIVLLGLYLAILCGALIPSEIIAASPQEFTDVHYYRDPAGYLLRSLLTASGLFALWGTVYGMLLAPKARKKYALCLAVIAAAAAVNYTFFGNQYGIISSELRYEAFTGPGTGTVLMNLAVTAAAAAAIFLLRKKWPLVLRIAALYGCAALAVMSLINVQRIHSGTGDTAAAAARRTEEKATFSLSRNGKNVVVIMLDRAISGFVPYFMDEKPELLRQFDGFTWYPNTLSYGYHTNIAAPALFGGYEYTPDGLGKRAGKTLKEKHNEALKIMPVNFLEAGFEVTVCDAPYANYQWIPDMSIYDDMPEVRTYNTIGMFDEYKVQMLENLNRNRNRNLFFYSLFRSAPLALQETLYDDGRWLEPDAEEDNSEGSELIGVSPDFLNSYMVMKNLGTLTRVTEDGTDTFLMLANEMTHDAIELQEPDYTPNNRIDNTAYEAEHGIRRTADGRELNLTEASDQVRIHYQSDMAAFIQLGRWFDELKAQGVWDNTRIIVVSDHGCYLGLTGVDLSERITDKGLLSRYLSDEWTDTTCFNPLLLVKDFGAKGFTTDNTFMTNAETPGLAFEGTVEHPVNPFTGKPVTREAGNGGEHHIVESDWHIVTNCGNSFSDPLRITFRGTDVFDPENWSVEE